MKLDFDQTWPALEPPRDFADRVLARADEPRITIEYSPIAGQTRRLTPLFWILASAAMLGFGLVGFWSQNRQYEERLASERAWSRERQTQAAELERLKAEVEAARAKEEQLQAALASAKDEMERSRAKVMAAEAVDSKSGTRAGAGRGAKAVKPGAHKSCNPNDPLCGF